jgi:cbb3-type cytochrome oxidase subunit 3
MKNLKSSFTLFFAMVFIAAMSFTSCGGKKDANNEAETEVETEVEVVENTENAEHPADSTEHPADNK